VSARFWFGTSSWNYKDWNGVFYSPGVSPKLMLAEYARTFATVEIDSTYYGIPRATSVESWRSSVGEEFKFSLKTPQAVTHERRFTHADRIFAAFVDRIRPLGQRLGVVLVQCAPNFGPSRENRAALFSFLETELPADIRIALELRDERWYDQQLFAHARANRFALAITEGSHAKLALAAKIVAEIASDPPADFAYIRWLGEQALPRYDRVQLDRSGSLDVWERFLRELEPAVADIFAYASNDYEGFAPATVRGMLARLGQPVPPETAELRLL
jgi:uncharacterized protein YecE (DUF72 family)